MDLRVLAIEIANEQDVVFVRQRARQLTSLLGFGVQDQSRVATAVSEVARYAFVYTSGGRVEFSVDTAVTVPYLSIRLRTQGEGAAGLAAALSGRMITASAQENLASVRRLIDGCEVESADENGTTVILKKRLPQPIDKRRLLDLIQQLAGHPASGNAVSDTVGEIYLQNRELMQTLAELKARQDELLSLTRELEDTNRGVVALYAEIEEKANHLRHADEMKSRFLSNTSHELRTPLSSIRALAKLLLDRVDGELTEEQEKQVFLIAKAADDLYELVNDLLDLAKIEAGKVEVKPNPFTVDDLFSALRGMLRPLSSGESVDLVFDGTEGESRLFTDEGKLSQILRNFISNALKFTGSGEVRVRAAREGNGLMRFSVSDTGLGIASDHLQLIFEEFSQIENPLQKRAKGTGLGLPLCKRLAILLGGTIDVESTLGVGSTFSLLLPMDYEMTKNGGTTGPDSAAADKNTHTFAESDRPTGSLADARPGDAASRSFAG